MISQFELFLLKRLIRHSCPDQIPVCGSERKGIKCYRVYLKNGAGKYLLYVEKINSKGISGTYWNDQNSKSFPASVPFSCMSDVSIEIQRLIDHWEFIYQSILKCALYDWTYFNRIKIIIDTIGQFFFNRRDFALKERTKVLKLLVEKYLENPNATFGEVDLVEILHGRRWVYHPNSWGLQGKAGLLLESFRESGELEFIENSPPSVFARYKLTGKALTTLETYERGAIRHEQIISQSRHMKWLTFALIVVGIIQAAVAYFK